LNSLAFAQLRRDQPKLAIETIERARGLAPEDPRTVHNHGVILSQANDFRAAANTLQDALRIDPTDKRTHRAYQGALDNWFRWYAIVGFAVAISFYVALAILFDRLGRRLPAIAGFPFFAVVFFLYSCIGSYLTPFQSCFTFRWLPGHRIALTRRQIRASNCIAMFTFAAAVVFMIDLAGVHRTKAGFTCSFFLVPLSWPVAAMIACQTRWLRVLLGSVVASLAVIAFHEVRLAYENSIIDCGSSWALVAASSVIASWLPRWDQFVFERRSIEAPFPQ
jgi:hypothetical protein